MDVPQSNPWPYLPGPLSASVLAPRMAPRTGAEVELFGSLLGFRGSCWGYLDIHGWGLGVPLGDGGSQGCILRVT